MPSNHLEQLAVEWYEYQGFFVRKFQTGEKHIRALFHGLSDKLPIEKIAVFGLGSRKNHQTVGAGSIKLIDEFLAEILSELKNVSWYKRAVPEQFPLIRTLQMVSEFRGSLLQSPDQKT